MKKNLYLFFLVTLISVGWRYESIIAKPFNKVPLIDNKQQKQSSSIYTLSEKDKKVYILSIDQNKIRKPCDTTFHHIKFKYLLIPLKLNNNSADTLRYVDMSCGWLDIFATNNKNISFLDHGCDKNIPKEFTVAPYNVKLFNIPLAFKEKSVAEGTKFRLSMCILKYTSNDQLFDFDYYSLSRKANNLIWSNTVHIPAL